MYYELTDHFVVAANLQTTWDFFSSAENLHAITPPWLRFVIQTARPIVLKQDSLIDYTIRWLGMPIRWRTKIIDWSPNRQFIDLQIRGPYSLWHHQHTFSEVQNGVECRDRVIYGLPVPGMGRLIHAMLVRRQLREIFQFRRKVIAKQLGWVEARQADIEIKAL